MVIEHSTKEYLDALARINEKQCRENLFVNISDQDVFAEIIRYREENR